MAFGWDDAAMMGAQMVGGGFSNALNGGGMFGKKASYRQSNPYTPQAQNAMSGLVGQGMQNSNFGDIANAEVSRFNKQTVPGIAERFTANFGPNAQRSSGFQSALGMAGSDLGERLASLRSQFGLQQLGMGLRPQIEETYIPRKPGFFEGLFGGATRGAGDYAKARMLGGYQQSSQPKPKSFADQMKEWQSANPNNSLQPQGQGQYNMQRPDIFNMMQNANYTGY